MAGRRRRARQALQHERALRLARFRLALATAREDLAVLARRLDDSPPWLDGEASVEWKLAADRCAQARGSLREVASLADALAVHTCLREAWFHLARSDALAYDEIPPSSSEPCWFDWRHGPAAAEVEWLGAGVVPVCRDDAERVAAGLAPRRRALRPSAFTDQADTSPTRRLMERQARGGGGYAQGALYAGPPGGAPF